jgi:drug/metabolite transporter (DMT)-like permease
MPPMGSGLARSPLLVAILLTIGAAFILNIEGVIVKLMGPAVPVAMVVCARSMAQLVWVSPSLLRHGGKLFRTNHPWLHLLRGVLSLTSWSAYYFSFRELPMATATVLSFTGIMWTTALAGPILGEVVRWRRWSATILGFLGVLLILRPGVLPLGLPTFAALFSALCGAGIVLTTKRLAATESTETIMLYIGLITTAGALPMALLHFAWLAPRLWLTLLLMAALGVTGMFMWISALRLADASLLSPINYIRLVFAAITGAMVFGELPDGFTWAGAALIVASAIYITRREATLKRSRTAGQG